MRNPEKSEILPSSSTGDVRGSRRFWYFLAWGTGLTKLTVGGALLVDGFMNNKNDTLQYSAAALLLQSASMDCFKASRIRNNS